ncbi:hypothetical protein ACP5ZK_004341, partial [Cronobacter malonaticus]
AGEYQRYFRPYAQRENHRSHRGGYVAVKISAAGRRRLLHLILMSIICHCTFINNHVASLHPYGQVAGQHISH